MKKEERKNVIDYLTEHTLYTLSMEYIGQFHESFR